MLLASFSRRVLVERSTRTENVVVFKCIQYSTRGDVCPNEPAAGDVARVLRYAIGRWRARMEELRHVRL